MSVIIYNQTIFLDATTTIMLLKNILFPTDLSPLYCNHMRLASNILRKLGYQRGSCMLVWSDQKCVYIIKKNQCLIRDENDLAKEEREKSNIQHMVIDFFCQYQSRAEPLWKQYSSEPLVQLLILWHINISNVHPISLRVGAIKFEQLQSYMCTCKIIFTKKFREIDFTKNLGIVVQGILIFHNK